MIDIRKEIRKEIPKEIIFRCGDAAPACLTNSDHGGFRYASSVFDALRFAHLFRVPRRSTSKPSPPRNASCAGSDFAGSGPTVPLSGPRPMKYSSKYPRRVRSTVAIAKIRGLLDHSILRTISNRALSSSPRCIRRIPKRFSAESSKARGRVMTTRRRPITTTIPIHRDFIDGR